ncbi:MAG: tRNA (adenosine(37)-N6)-threonylcarbamoyltransferase complex dimerization subunit type 1 TsaB [Ginsengibacter sp.]
MAYILQIDTSTENAIVSLCNDEQVLKAVISSDQKNHASFLQPAIKSIVQDCNVSFTQLDAVGVIIGPGSYTGLRVGLATAKGLCYALKKPLLTLNTLGVMAITATLNDDAEYYCPMIDARRMEVFTAVYNKNLEPVVKPCALVLEATSFNELFQGHKVILNGNGAKKFIDISENKNLIYIDAAISPVAMAKLFFDKFITGEFADVAYTQPFYAKPFYTIQPKSL